MWLSFGTRASVFMANSAITTGPRSANSGSSDWSIW